MIVLLSLTAVKGYSGQDLSLFRWELADPPVFLLPPPDDLGMLAILSLVPVAGLALWIMPRAADPKFWALCFLGYGLAASVLAVGYDVRSGVALYEDRLAYRTNGPFSPLHIVAYRDIQTIRTACVSGGRRSPGRASYAIETPYGHRLELPTPTGDMLGLIVRLDEQAVAGGAKWLPDTHARNGRLLYDRHCLDRMVSPDRSEQAQIRRLLRFHHVGF